MQRAVQGFEKLSAEDKADVDTKVKKLRLRIDEEPKSSGWKFRSRVGDKKKWYREIEELSRE